MTKVTKNQPTTEVVHMHDGNTHLVGVKSLRVMLSNDGSGWFAQGLEIDYASAGASIEEAKSNFELGLALTICEHLKMHGNLEKLLQVASSEAWQEFFSAPEDVVKARYSQILATQLLEKLPAAEKKQGFRLPFDAIDYLNSEPVAA